jgi:hypothetical protein
MQHGCMERLNRKRGPEVWQFRWSVTGPDGKRLYHKKIVGTVERYPDENAARRALVGLVLEINTDAFRVPRFSSNVASDQQSIAEMIISGLPTNHPESNRHTWRQTQHACLVAPS